ncbi:uncharacterized protein [Excalfactoria chinensis]|uniref:uncharacterized protein n=1 Tax=Excalfactoria chinensis TaxID=46218 RepID=UPI003B3B40D9
MESPTCLHTPGDGSSCAQCRAQPPAGAGDQAAEIEEVNLAPATGPDSGGESKDDGSGGPPSTTETEKEGGKLREGITALSSTSEAAPECTAAELSSATEGKEEGGGASLQEDVAALCDVSESDPQHVAGASSHKSKRKESQTSSSEEAKQSADLIASDGGGVQESGSAGGCLGRKAEGLEVVAGGGDSSVAVMNPSEESSTDKEAAPSPNSAALKEVGGVSTTQHGVMEEKSAASDAGQAAESGRDSQSLDGKKKPASMGEKTDVSSGVSPDIEVPKSKPVTSCAEHPSQDTKTPLVAKSSKAGKGKEEGSSRKVSSLPSKGKDTREKKIPNERAQETSEKTKRTNQTNGPQAARRNNAPSVTGKGEEKPQQNNQKPMDEEKQSEGVTVYFHAILSKDFNLNPDIDKVFVTSGGFSDSGQWEYVCEMSCVKNLDAHGYLMDGYATLPVANINKYIPYKYWISCGDGGEYEFICKKEKTAYLNRCLCVDGRFINGRGELFNLDLHIVLLYGLLVGYP